MTDQKCPKCGAGLLGHEVCDSRHRYLHFECGSELLVDGELLQDSETCLRTQLAAAKDELKLTKHFMTTDFKRMKEAEADLAVMAAELAALKAVLGQVHKWVDGLISYRHGDDEANIIDILSTIPAPVAVVEIPDSGSVEIRDRCGICELAENYEHGFTATITTNEKRGEDDG